ncbi:hypothetical protein RB68_047 [Enterobacteria phage RB68]|uniref:Uncharacterized protein RB51ncORF048c n=1 Tax=Enterobacteria phage RB51 TaxID=10693 RepID=C3V234_BPR51|nr:hypothetical protein RB51ORF048 [Enterobacteria phage RB51]YP_009167416.1 hypothetical protein RB68_047 [Enterobacteria phage RB68]ACP30966.1 hypothetical protein RB51ORF048 [Enterobacteria phage RB51]AIT75507.1 hypothetical protein RB68_047 [Enterobacteria phage RB68]UJJ74432.1 hypothetical protein CPTAc3_048 [Enterobacteria phage Ac3]
MKNIQTNFIQNLKVINAEKANKLFKVKEFENEGNTYGIIEQNGMVTGLEIYNGKGKFQSQPISVMGVRKGIKIEDALKLFVKF